MGGRLSAVKYELQGEVAVVTIANPPVNALNFAVREGLAQSLERAAQDPVVTAIVLVLLVGSLA